jgi:PAS domain S-box-containing protein
MEAELKDSEERYRALVIASSSMIWRADPHGFIIEGFGRDAHSGEFRDAYKGHGWIDEVHPEDRSSAIEGWRKILVSARPGENRFRLRRSDGQYRWFVSRAAPLKHPDGTVREWVGSLTDIHEHRMAQANLWETNERLASALRAGRMMAWDWNLETSEVTRSDTSLEVLGLPSGDITAFLDRVHDDDRASYQAAFEAASRGTGAYEVEFRFHKPDGRTVWMRETGQIDFSPDGKPARARGLVFDISERRQAEESLQESERRLSTLLDNLPGFAYRCANSAAWPMEYLSEGIRTITGYAPADLLEAGTVAWGDLIHPEDREAVWDKVQEAVRRNLPFEFTYRVRTRLGEERWVRERGQGVRRPNGEIEALEGFVSDITEQRRTEERLRQSQKMEAVGQLTGGIAHDFNNLLTVILGNAEILVDDPANPALTRTLSQMIVEAAEKGAELTQHLLAFGRRQSLKPVRVSLDHVVRGMTPLLQRTLGEHIELRAELAHSLYSALTDRTLLESAILNLAVNAKDAMPQGGTLTITTGETTAGLDQGALPIGQDVVFITVSDTGCGMSPEVLSRAFEPFFTTKEVGRGSGLGLSMVYGFAQQSGGHVQIESAPDKGTAVTILLPAVVTVPGRAAPQEERLAVPGRGRVLLVEDEPQVLQFVSAQLVSLGYEVTAVSTGPDALDLLRGERPFDLLFTDVVLPRGMSGVELASHARRIRPGIKVLLTSGYPEEVFEHHGSPEQGTLLLRKPYKRRELAETLRKVLDWADL